MAIDYPSLDNPTAGAFRFNTDSSHLEIYDGNQWVNALASSPELRTGGTRGLWWNGYEGSSNINKIEYINVDTTGNATDFGDSTVTQDKEDHLHQEVGLLVLVDMLIQELIRILLII